MRARALGAYHLRDDLAHFGFWLELWQVAASSASFTESARSLGIRGARFFQRNLTRQRDATDGLLLCAPLAENPSILRENSQSERAEVILLRLIIIKRAFPTVTERRAAARQRLLSSSSLLYRIASLRIASHFQ